MKKKYVEDEIEENIDVSDEYEYEISDYEENVVVEESDDDIEESGDDIEESDDDIEESDDDSADDDDIEDDEDVDDEEEDEESYKRRMRRNRRIRSQIISYSIAVLILALIGVGLFFLGKKAISMYGNLVAQKNAEAEVEAMTQEHQEEIVIEAPQEIEEIVEETDTEDEDYYSDMLAKFIEEMSIEDKVAQMFMITPEQLTGVANATEALGATESALKEHAVGGLVYAKENITDADQISSMITNTQEMSKYKLFIAAYEPGGENGLIAGSSLADIPETKSPLEIGEGDDSIAAYNTGNEIGAYLSALGFNLDISPSGDMVMGEEAVNYVDSYGVDEAKVSDMVVKMIEGLGEQSVGACITNFPGTGNIKEDTSKGVVESQLSPDIVTGQLVPYISGIAAKSQMIMMSNVKYVLADETGAPASLSSYMIETMLRGNMGYDGIVVTGPLNEKAITQEYTSGEAAVAAVIAGADIIYMPENFTEAYDGLLEAVKSGKISENRINESLERILKVKNADQAN